MNTAVKIAAIAILFFFTLAAVSFIISTNVQPASQEIVTEHK